MTKPMPEDSRGQISNLVFRYAECVDAGDFEGLAELFAHGEISAEGTPLLRRGSTEVLALFVDGTRRYPDGTPRTKHVTTNLLIDIDETGRTATSRSYFTVLQEVSGALVLQPIIAGRYHDTFVMSDSTWRFATRHMIVDLVGELGHHLLGGYRP